MTRLADLLTPAQRAALGRPEPVRIIPVAEYDPRDYVVAQPSQENPS